MIAVATWPSMTHFRDWARWTKQRPVEVAEPEADEVVAASVGDGFPVADDDPAARYADIHRVPVLRRVDPKRPSSRLVLAGWKHYRV